MTLLRIHTIPDPILQTPAASINNIDADILTLASDLTDTIRHHEHCIGIAAPQVGRNVRMIAVDVSLARKPHHNHGLLILLNPRIIQSTGKQTGREGCLSVPDFVGLVTRHSAVLVEALDLKGETIRIETKGFEAVALQHEIDHLDGILFLDRVRSLKTDIIRRQFP